MGKNTIGKELKSTRNSQCTVGGCHFKNVEIVSGFIGSKLWYMDMFVVLSMQKGNRHDKTIGNRIYDNNISSTANKALRSEKS